VVRSDKSSVTWPIHFHNPAPRQQILRSGLRENAGRTGRHQPPSRGVGGRSDQAIAAFAGDARATVKALIVLTDVEAHVEELASIRRPPSKRERSSRIGRAPCSTVYWIPSSVPSWTATTAPR
jgi:hypothetical protein